jgi:hypothetical protein
MSQSDDDMEACIQPKGASSPPSFLPLSVVFDTLWRPGELRDRAFVRRISGWLQERAQRIELDVVSHLGLQGVVLTFAMKERVGLVVTGLPPGDLPGEVTLTLAESDFPHVGLRVHASAVADPYEVCTMDYAFAGTRVRVLAGRRSGDEGSMIVASTIGLAQSCRVRMDSGEVIALGFADVDILGQP